MSDKPVKQNGRMMYMPRDHWMSTRKGVAMDFKANVPQLVPYRACDEVIAIGGVFANKEEQKILVDEKPELVVPETGFEREQQVYDACMHLGNKNAPESFTPAGKPTLKAIKDIVGYDVDRKEVNDIWTKAMKSLANSH